MPRGGEQNGEIEDENDTNGGVMWGYAEGS